MTSEQDPIYLDHNASTPVLPAVLDAMLPYLREHFGNPSSGHVYGERAQRAIGRARAEVASLLGCTVDEILFTSGGTESNNLAIRGVIARCPAARRHIVTSTVEHPATARPIDYLEQRGFAITRLAVDATGQVPADTAREHIRADTALVTLMLAQNETGTLMPVAAVAQAARSCGAIVHTDAAQAVGKIPTRVDELGVDLLSVAGHKLYAPKGVGALYVRRGVLLAPLALGAGHERGLRPGTENVAGVVGLGAACALAEQDLQSEAARQRSLRDELQQRLAAAIPGLRLNGHSTERLPNTINVSFPAVRGNAVLRLASHVAASTGSACHEGAEQPSPVLSAMGVAPELALGAIRLSLGRSSTRAAVIEAAEALIAAYAALRAESQG